MHLETGPRCACVWGGAKMERDTEGAVRAHIDHLGLWLLRIFCNINSGEINIFKLRYIFPIPSEVRT